jgi:hypothetical protein
LGGEALANLLALGERLSEGSGGRAYLYPHGLKIAEQIGNVGQRLSLGRSVATRVNSHISAATPPTTTEAFQYGSDFQITKVEDKNLGVKFEVLLALPQPETPGEAASTAPTVRTVVDNALSGTATFNSNGLLLLVMDPSNRLPREEFLLRAGEGPWTVFSSPEFRGGLTDWVITVQIR